MDNQVYIVTHKECELPLIKGYKPLAVGALGKMFPEEYIRDDSGINISEKNDSYCELTGLFWMWKNSTSNNIGLVHYRRFFVNIKKCIKIKGRYVFFSKKNKYSILSVDELEGILKNHDILVKMSDVKKITNSNLFETYLGSELWNNLKKVIYENYAEYKETFDDLGNKKSHINCNMFYGNKKLIDQYSEWVFDVLNQVDNLHSKTSGTRYHNRELGYLAEFLFGVWIEKNNINYKVLPVVNVGDSYAMDGCLNFGQLIKFLIIKPLNHIFKLNLK